MTIILDTLRVSPAPPADAVEVSLPLSHFDLIWLHFHPIRRLLFYHFPCSTSYFYQTLLPLLNQSLSLALRHYTPVAGNLLYPLDTDDDHKKPFFRYVPGDSLQLNVAESTHDFDELVGNHQRDADQFYDFVPQMPPIEEERDYKIVPVMALQVTLFPDRGVCIGFANHHTLGDASSIIRFMCAWAHINKLGGRDDEEYFIKHDPLFDRSAINDHLGIDEIYWKDMRKMAPLRASTFPLPTKRVRATYTLHAADIMKLKNLVLRKKPELGHVSSFVVTSSYIWTCLVKSGDAIGEEVDEEVLEYFIFTVDIRGGRVDPPVPENYFGNCLSYGMGKLKHRKVVEKEDGLAAAAESIAVDIRTRVNKKEEVIKGVENWMSEWEKFTGIRVLGVSGSPRFDVCGADFGWGRARNLEVLSIDGEKYSMSLCRSGASEGALEVGISLPEDRMKAFAAIFADGLL